MPIRSDVILACQPESTVLGLLGERLAIGNAECLRVATAYASYSGVKELIRTLPSLETEAFPKEFLLGIDWFRSDPAAINALSSLPRTRVTIHDGRTVLSAEDCIPERSFHPKTYLVTGRPNRLIVGSANLSLNGLKRSVEISITTNNAQCISDFNIWFDREFAAATNWNVIREEYRQKFNNRPREKRVVQCDIEAPDEEVFRRRWITAERIYIMQTAQHLWIDVGNLHNRDPQGLPGTDLQFAAMSRIFFGAPAIEVPGNTPLGNYDLTMDHALSKTRPMVFNRSSSMDRLSLPIPGEDGWPAKYDGETLLFTKQPDLSFKVTMAQGPSRRSWIRRSRQSGFHVVMQQSNREWGAF